MKKIMMIVGLVAMAMISCAKPEIHDYVCTQTATMDVNVGFLWGDKEITIVYQTNDDMHTFELMNTYDEYRTINNQQVLIHLNTTCKIKK